MSLFICYANFVGLLCSVNSPVSPVKTITLVDVFPYAIDCYFDYRSVTR